MNFTEIKENISLYTKYLEYILKDKFKDLRLLHTEGLSIENTTDVHKLYIIDINSPDINNRSYANVIGQRNRDLYDLEGVIDLRFHSDRNSISLVYNLSYFEDNDLFKSLNSVQKFNL